MESIPERLAEIRLKIKALQSEYEALSRAHNPPAFVSPAGWTNEPPVLISDKNGIVFLKKTGLPCETYIKA